MKKLNCHASGNSSIFRLNNETPIFLDKRIPQFDINLKEMKHLNNNNVNNINEITAPKKEL